MTDNGENGPDRPRPPERPGGAPPPVEPPRSPVEPPSAPTQPPPSAAPPSAPPTGAPAQPYVPQPAPGAPGQPTPTPTPSPSPTAKQRSRAPWIAGGVALVAALGLGGLALTAGGGDDEAATTTTTAPATTAAPTTEAPTTAETAPQPPSVAEIAASSVQLLLLDDNNQALCSGSGTIVDVDGTILTNTHVIISDSLCPFTRIGIAITTDSGRPPELTYEADIFAADSELDLAVVRIARTLDGEDVTEAFPALPLGDSDAVEIGEPIRILGYPAIGGDTITFTDGAVSGFTAQAEIGDRSWIKTDATISGGNSGGTAVNTDGQLIGIPTQVAAGSDAPAVDCRILADTNGDQLIDENDQCVPIGGFLNGIRPVNLALPLLEESRSASPIAISSLRPPAAEVTVDVSQVFASQPGFSLGIAEPAENTEFVVTAAAGQPELCFWFNWSGIPDGATWDAVWVVDGEIDDDYSLFEQTWEYGLEGFDFWVCALNEEGIPPGLYEVVFFVEGEIVFVEAIRITAEPAAIHPVTFENETERAICFLQFNPAGSSTTGLDELGLEQTIAAGDSATFPVPAGAIVAEAYDCEGNLVAADLQGIPIEGPETITMAP